ncbi:hypothetical protein FBU59_003011, partial [Linderina macrospora]
IAYGLKYSTLLINVPQYLQYLKTRFERSGGRVIQAHLDHIRQAPRFVQAQDDPPLVINCTALGSRSLGGVSDQKLYPIRGQTLVVNAPAARRTLTRLGKSFAYVIPRGDGTVVIGGTANRGSWDSAADESTTDAILAKALTLEPALVPTVDDAMDVQQQIEALRQRIISVNVGFRPAREGGVRLEVEKIDSAFTVIHCYGHAGFGYQSSVGYGKAVLNIAPPRPSRATRSAKPEAETPVVIINQEDTSDKTPVRRQQRSQPTSSASPTKQSVPGALPAAETPQKRAPVDSPLSTPRSPASYGRRSSSTRRLSASGSLRRVSGIFVGNDELIDGISPIKHDGPLEDLAEADEDSQTSRYNGRALEFGLVKRRRTESAELDGDDDKVVDAVDEGNASSDDSRFVEEPVAEDSQSEEESDSDVFDIDKLVAETATTSSAAASKLTRASRTNVASRMASGELTTKDWLEEPSVGGRLPRRHRAQQPQPKSPTKKPAKRAAAANGRGRKPAGDAGSSGESAHEPDDSWKPEMPATRPIRTRATGATKTTARTTYGKRRAAAATLHPPQAEAWGADAALANHFDDIDNFELAEETV